MSKNGIYILSVSKAVGQDVKNIDSLPPKRRQKRCVPIRVTLDSQKGSYRLVGAFMELVHEQFGYALNLLKSKIFKNKYKLLYEVGAKVDLGNKIYDGPSIGLPIFLALVAKLCNFDILCKLGATGELNKYGKVLKIGLLHEKLTNAANSGITIVIIPQENLIEAKVLCNKYPELNKIRIICVDHVSSAALALYNISHYGIVDEISN